MQRSGGGAVFGEINVNSRRPLIPNVLLSNLDVTRLRNALVGPQQFPVALRYWVVSVEWRCI
ncbi:hypothetical protein K227x_14210 [Rubripirellula lacrimiformis]|uniref:Uncharacterized protein n=1 Tax=Rubripirellula lacrimiformis TaxID=1930273 RepID=A0A517N7E0_9BACT|nr:hypothetical protein K227x_14210 [Rubripirellula lacrimiformis]